MPLCSLRDLDESTGTVQLHSHTDTGSKLDTIVLVPSPSENDPNDPLRWPVWRKNVTFASVCAFTFLTNYGIGGLGPAFYILSLEFNKTMAEISELATWPILILGVFNFFWVPMANYFGKRPVFVFASLLLTLCYIWGAKAQSFESLLWSNIVAAFAGSSTEALGASIVNDLYFLHERGAKMGIYMNSISGGNTIGPLLCGFIIQGLSWRWHKWIAVILTTINFFLVLCFVPETRYYRKKTCSDADQAAEPCPTLSSQKSQFTSADKEQAAQTEVTASGSPPSLLPERTSLREVPKKTYVQEISLWSGVAPDTNLLKSFMRPLPMIVYPCVVYAFLGYAVSLVLTVAVNILNPFVLQKPPYNWSPMMNSLINIPGFIGNVAGAYAGGWLVDLYSDWLARKNHGVFEPESRLWLLALPTIVTGAGCLVFGFGVQQTWHWASLFFGYGMVSFALTAVPTITMTYVSDCVFPVNADALMLVNGLKNVVAFGFLYGIVPWVETAGYVVCFGAQTGIFMGVVALGAILLLMFGKKIRRTQATWKIIL